jgi:N-methylhydantoinase B
MQSASSVEEVEGRVARLSGSATDLSRSCQPATARSWSQASSLSPIRPGGGGYGDPLERDPKRVLHDLEEGWITAERAQSAYGVATADSDEPGVPTLDESARRC